MSKSAVVLCLNGKRRTVKFNPNTTIFQILEDVCKKENVDPSLYNLKTQKSVLDKSLPWRFANLPNNAKLELCASTDADSQEESFVQIAVQTENGRRLTSRFSTSTALTAVLEHFGDELGRLTPSTGVPAIVYMRQEVVGSKALSRTSLRALGIMKGNALLRLSFKPSTPSAEDKESQSSLDRLPAGPESPPSVSDSFQSFSSLESGGSSASQAQISQDPRLVIASSESTMSVDDSENDRLSFADALSRDADAVSRDAATRVTCKPRAAQQPSSSREMSNEPEITSAKLIKLAPVTAQSNNGGSPGSEVNGESVGSSASFEIDESLSQPCPRHEALFVENAQRSVEYDDVSDEFFEVTLSDVRKMFADLKHETAKLSNANLVTEAQRNSKKLRIASRCPKVILRVVFPGRYVLQGNFKPLERISALYDFVRSHVTFKDFYLFTAPPKKMLDSEAATLLECGLCPASRIYFGSKHDVSPADVIKPTSLEALMSSTVPSEVPRMVAPSSSEESSTSGSSESAPIASDVTGQPPHPPPSQSSDVKDGDAKLKKLFKFGSKR